MNLNYDVAIIGAGPAGCTCALALHGSGLRVVIIDKESFPRDKICGDAIPGNTFKAFDKINPAWGDALRMFAEKTNIHTSRIFSTNGKMLSINWKMPAYNSKRIHFDNFLVDLVRSETSSIFLENKRLRQIRIENDNASCRFMDGSELSAGIIIGCDGANSIVARQTGDDNFRNSHTSAAVRSYYSGVAGIDEGTNEFHLFKELPGYFWIFPLKNGLANVGFGISGNHLKKRGETLNLRNSFDNIISGNTVISARFKNAERLAEIKGFALPVWTHKKSVSGNRYMLCGDAASLIDPLQGHGIDKSAWSGLLAAEQAILCFRSQDFTAGFMARYDKKLYHKVGNELARSAIILQLIVRFPGLLNFISRSGIKPGFTNWMARKLKI